MRSTFVLLTVMLFTTLVACKKEVVIPTVTTVSVTGITPYTAEVNTFVSNDGGSSITVTGVCWGTDYNPDLTDSVKNVGGTIGSFTALLSGLQPATTYHVRAFASNSAGTAYGFDMDFTTLH